MRVQLQTINSYRYPKEFVQYITIAIDN